MEQQKVEVLGIRPQVWIIGICVVLFFLFASVYAGLWTIVLVMGTNWNHGYLIAANATMVVFSLINYLLPTKLKMRPQELAILFVMVASASVFSGNVYPYEIMFYPGLGIRTSATLLAIYGDIEQTLKVIPAWYAPAEISAIEAMRFGGQTVPWSAWTPFLTFWITWFILLLAMFSFLASIVRKQWIETEMLTFPYVVPYMTLLDTVASTDPKAAEIKGRGRLLLIALAIGVLIQIPDFFHILNPAIPGLPFWSNYWIKWSVDLIPFFPSLGDAMPGSCFIFTWGPIYALALWFLLPLDVLGSMALFYYLFYIVLPPAFVAAGLIKYDPTWGSYSRWANVARGGTIQPMLWGDFGLLWLGIFALVFQWRYVVGTLKGLLGKPDISEENEALPYRYSWLGLIVTFVLLVALIMVTGGGAIGSIGAILGILLWQLGMMRLRAEAGIFFTNSSNGNYMAYYFTGGSFPTTATQADVTVSQWAPYMLLGHTWGVWSHGGNNSGVVAMDSFKMLAHTKTNTRMGFVTIFIASLIPLIIAPIIGLIWVYQYGATVMPGLNYYWVRAPSYWGNFNPSVVSQPRPIWIDMAISGVLMFVLMLARTTIPGFPISPIGPIIGLGYYTVDGVGSMWLWVFIAKILVLKIGGARLYSEKGVPIAVGLFLGGAFVYLLNIAVALPISGGGWFAWGPS